MRGYSHERYPCHSVRGPLGERTIRSVANLTRTDAEEFLEPAPRVPVKTRTIPYPLANANEALEALREGRIEGAAVMVPHG
jgi:propanol-preferring alcohol dehydrogenase